MSSVETISFYEFFQKFPNEESARLYFESKRWGDKVVCAHCGSVNVNECKDHKPMAYRCRDCRQHFSARTGTVLSESRLPLHKWLMAIYMMTTARKGIASTQMARQLGITQKTAWFLAQRIRESFVNNQNKLDGIVEVDETYFGGKESNKHAYKRQKLGRGIAGKQAVIGAVQRQGNIIAQPVTKTDRETLQGFINDNVDTASHVITDEHRSYIGLNNSYNHSVVNHSSKEYVNGMAHTNGIESFWALLKRGHYGVFHNISKKHLYRYVNEFCFRHNTSKVSTMDFIDRAIGNMDNKRLTYEDLVNA